MKNEKLLIFVSFLSVCSGKVDVEKLFKKNEIVPDVLHTAPPHVLEVSFPASEQSVHLGNELAPVQVRQQPTIRYKHAESDKYYTIIMTDPDAPSRETPTNREWHHWLVVNAKGAKPAAGEHLSAYVGSGPPKGTGLHRYVFILYEQLEKLEFDEPKHSANDGKRGKFSTEKFADKYHLGSPIAGNFFQAQYDDSVPSLHKQLGF